MAFLGSKNLPIDWVEYLRPRVYGRINLDKFNLLNRELFITKGELLSMDSMI